MSAESNEDQFSSSNCIYVCVACKKTFSTKSNLGRHIKTSHKDNDVLLNAVKETKKPLKYKCESCNVGYSHKKNFNFHQRKFHGASPTSAVHSCAICKNTFKVKNLIQHLQTEHKIDMKYENYEFASLKEFSKWKNDLEKNTRSIYVKYANWTRSDNKCNIFQCHRSGKFHPRSRVKGLRRLKEHGSNKINAYCPASIKVAENNGQYFVSYQTTHVGHQNDLGHLKLSDDEKKFIALKIAAKIPFNKILEDIRDNIPNSGLERIHLLTRKDLQNIVRSIKSGKWAQDIKGSNETSFEIVKNEEDSLNHSSIIGAQNKDDIHIESSFEVIKSEEDIFDKSPPVADLTSYKIPEKTDCSNMLQIPHKSPSEADGKNEEPSLEFIKKEVETFDETPAATVGAENEVDRMLEHFTHKILSFQERLHNIQNEYFNLIDSVSSEEELNILESNLKSVKATIDAFNIRKSNEVSLNIQRDLQYPANSNIIPQKCLSVKNGKNKLPENLFRKLRLVQNENDMVSLIMSYKNQQKINKS